MSLCAKRKHDSEQQVRRYMRNAGFRYRSYRCPDCGFLHVSASEKRENRAAIEKHTLRRRRKVQARDQDTE